jgi:hypothetical protein
MDERQISFHRVLLRPSLGMPALEPPASLKRRIHETLSLLFTFEDQAEILQVYKLRGSC